jgi:hypothetical protein
MCDIVKAEGACELNNQPIGSRSEIFCLVRGHRRHLLQQHAGRWCAVVVGTRMAELVTGRRSTSVRRAVGGPDRAPPASVSLPPRRPASRRISRDSSSYVVLIAFASIRCCATCACQRRHARYICSRALRHLPKICAPIQRNIYVWCLNANDAIVLLIMNPFVACTIISRTGSTLHGCLSMPTYTIEQTLAAARRPDHAICL